MLRNWKQILWLAIPSLVSFATQTVTGTISLIMVGQLGALVIAIVGVSNIIMYNAFAIFSGIGHTLNYLVAQNYGADDMKKGVQRMNLALYLCGAIGILLLIVGWLAAGDVLRWTGGAELAEVGGTYLEIRFYAMAFGIISFSFHGFLRGIGATRTSMVISLICNGLILFLTYTLTFGALGFPELGLTGTGLAVLIGEAVGLLLCVYVYFIRLHPRFQTRTWPVFDTAEAKLILQESGKLGVQEFSLSITMLIFTGFVARLGTEALAANEIALNIMSFGFMPAFAFGATATIIVGQEIGRGAPHKARRAGTDTAILGSLFLLILGTIEFIWAENITKLYIADNPEVFELAAHLIMISAYLQLFDGLLNFYAGGLRGIGDTTFLLRISALLSWLLFVPLTYLLIFVAGLGSIGAWLGLYTFLVVFGIAVMVRFYRTDWANVKLKEATRREADGSGTVTLEG
jgi:putative MATE family efflux protein